MNLNFPVLLIAALVPTVVGFLYYHPKLMGTAWMKASGMTDEKIKGGNMPVIFGVSLVLSLMLALQVNMLVVHQGHVASLLVDEEGFGQEGSEVMNTFNGFMEKYGKNFRTFKHGAFHGVLSGLFFVLPILGTNALFERKGFKYIAINSLYWIITLALMGGVICQWS